MKPLLQALKPLSSLLRAPTTACHPWRVAALGLIVALVGCGGGGGGGSTPRFQSVTVGASTGIRDNTTGLTWFNAVSTPTAPVTQPGSSRLPYASELLTLIHTTTDAERQANFSYAFKTTNPYFTLADTSASGVSWIIDAGGYNTPPGIGVGTLNEQGSSADSTQWYVLTTNTPVAYNLPTSASSELITSGRLMWHLCVEGTSWNGSNGCTGTASAYTYTGATTQARNARYGGYNDWRMPTLLELQNLLQLDASAGPYIAALFRNGNPAGTWDTSNPNFHTSTTSGDNGAGGFYRWSIHFGWGRVSPVNDESDPRYLLLVRTIW